MERRGLSWRSIPPELGVPTVMAVLVDLIGLAVPPDQGGPALSLGTGLTRLILMAYGLLVLRRRAAGRASALLAVGAALQGVAAAVALATSLTGVLFERADRIAVWDALSYGASGATVAFAVVMVGAARAWRSPLAPIAIVTSLLWHMPHVLGALVYSHVHGRMELQGLYILMMLAAQVALLGLYARIGSVEAPADPTAAERGARRVALALRLRAGLVAGTAVVFAVLAVQGPSVWALVLGGVIGLAALGVVVGQITGLLAMGAARLASLSSSGLYLAAFAALWDVLITTSTIAFQRGRMTTLVAVTVVVVSTAGMVVAGWAVHGVAGLRRDRELRGAIANRISWLIAVQIVNALAVGLVGRDHPTHAMGLVLVSQAMQLTATLLLAGLFARIADRIQVNAAADVF